MKQLKEVEIEILYTNTLFEELSSSYGPEFINLAPGLMSDILEGVNYRTYLESVYAPWALISCLELLPGQLFPAGEQLIFVFSLQLCSRTNESQFKRK